MTPLGVAIDAQGRIVVSGPSFPPASPPAEVIRRLTADGVLDEGFGASGVVSLSVGPSRWGQTGRSLPDARIGLLGAVPVEGGGGTFAARLREDGSFDPTFTAQPVLVNSAGLFSRGLWQDDGSAFVFGAQGVVRLDPSGAADRAFASGALLPPAASGALTADRKLYAGAGNRVSRYLPDGSLDSTFGQSGVVDLLSTRNGFPVLAVQTVLTETGGALVVASHAAGGIDYTDVARLTSAGGMDASYAHGGFLSLQTNGGPVGAARRSDGRLVVWTSYGDLLIVAPDGTPQGIWDLQVLGTVLAAVLDASERLVLVGMLTDEPPDFRWFVRRYLLP